MPSGRAPKHPLRRCVLNRGNENFQKTREYAQLRVLWLKSLSASLAALEMGPSCRAPDPTHLSKDAVHEAHVQPLGLRRQVGERLQGATQQALGDAAVGVVGGDEVRQGLHHLPRGRALVPGASAARAAANPATPGPFTAVLCLVAHPFLRRERMSEKHVVDEHG